MADVERGSAPALRTAGPLTLGASFLDPAGVPATHATLRYDFRPTSGTGDAGFLYIGGGASNQVTMQLPGTAAQFAGKVEPCKGGLECIAIFDGTSWRLELLAGHINTRFVRGGAPAILPPAPPQPAAAKPAPTLAKRVVGPEAITMATQQQQRQQQQVPGPSTTKPSGSSWQERKDPGAGPKQAPKSRRAAKAEAGGAPRKKQPRHKHTGPAAEQAKLQPQLEECGEDQLDAAFDEFFGDAGELGGEEDEAAQGWVQDVQTGVPEPAGRLFDETEAAEAVEEEEEEEVVVEEEDWGDGQEEEEGEDVEAWEAAGVAPPAPPPPPPPQRQPAPPHQTPRASAPAPQPARAEEAAMADAWDFKGMDEEEEDEGEGGPDAITAATAAAAAGVRVEAALDHDDDDDDAYMRCSEDEGSDDGLEGGLS